MIKHLSMLVESFPSTPNQTCCFTHILNLVAKSILCQFDVAKKASPDDSEQLDDATKELAMLAGELELDLDGDDDKTNKTNETDEIEERGDNGEQGDDG